ncbi:MAG: winged helix-turn-helix domain-containing protein [Candidatus Bathyarchaeota archaeon]
MVKRRSKLEIMLDVLRVVHDGISKPTRIMYNANMSWNPTQRVLEKLIDEGHILVEEKPSKQRAKKRYYITEKGLNILRYFKGAERLIEI